MAFGKLGIIGRTYRHVRRYRQILTVFFKYGFGDLLERLHLNPIKDLGRKLLPQQEGAYELHSRAERIRMAIEELGPTFIKMGQILSTRPDLLPVELLEQMEKLQSDVPAFPMEDVRAIVEEELDAPLDTIFDRFDETPLAAASIAQVHRARLAGSHDDVVVKIQRPNVDEMIEVDLEILAHLAALMEKYVEGLDAQRPTKIIQELAAGIEQELDFEVESAHMERFTAQFEDDPTIHVPKVCRNHSTQRVLTMEYIEGVRPSNLEALRTQGYDLKRIAHQGADLLMRQIFEFGFFHGDPHPGNLFVMPGHVLCYLDLGMTGRLNRMMKERFADLVVAVGRRDPEKTASALVTLAPPDEDDALDLDMEGLERDVAEFLDRHFYRPIREVRFGAMMRELFLMATRYRLRVPANIYMMLKALATWESLARQLDPDFDIAQETRPFVEKLQWDRLRPARITNQLVESGFEMAVLLKEIPGQLREIMQQAKRGRIKIEFEHRGLEPMLEKNDQISNRLAFSIVLSALVIGSSLMVLAKVPPLWNEIPLIGLGGFLFAGIMGFWLLISIIKHHQL
ncbi:putative protein kinase UbiB [Planctomycetes bacterium Pan216]|uniref:ABC1 atypical kinase-like domain-containing protein n=1 Tax=Kolteria novifilia TaxID=2527975 RepID=A0A518B6L2_9BACT|nr:putative protein kinase UbiB [Planctomycetes bacterium Pan216]